MRQWIEKYKGWAAYPRHSKGGWVYLNPDGSQRRYYHQDFNQNPGTFYLTTGWPEVGTDITSRHGVPVQQDWEQSASWIMDQQSQHYKKLVIGLLTLIKSSLDFGFKKVL